MRLALGSPLRPYAALRMTIPGDARPVLAASAGGFGLGDDANDRSFAGGARLAVVADEKVFDDFVDAGVLEAGEFGVFVKRNIARAPDEAQAAEQSAGFTLEDL
jgi:hypothetical protein